MTPQDVLEAIVEGLKQSTAFDGGDYATESLDLEGTNNRYKQPIVTLQPATAARADQWNTDLVGYTTDDAGNQTGRIFEAVFEMDIQTDLWVAGGNTQLDATSLGGDLQQALFQYDSQLVGDPLPDGAGGTADDIREFGVGDGTRADDLAGPGVRRWRQDLSAMFVDRVTTDDEYVEVVDTPTDGSATGDDDVAIELTVS